jgi:hypothetical protein
LSARDASRPSVHKAKAKAANARSARGSERPRTGVAEDQSGQRPESRRTRAVEDRSWSGRRPVRPRTREGEDWRYYRRWNEGLEQPGTAGEATTWATDRHINGSPALQDRSKHMRGRCPAA